MNANNNFETKRCIPIEFLEYAKLPTADKMAIFEDRQSRILNFLASEGYSGINNIAALIGTHRQTVMRIMNRFCNEQYVTKYTTDCRFPKKVVIYQITNTGMMLAQGDVKNMLHWQQLSGINNLPSFRYFQLQAIRIDLQKFGYSQFQKSWQLLQANHPICSNDYKIPEYFCLDSDGNKVAIEYETTIQCSKSYQHIIEQYVKAKQAEIIDKVLFFTRKDFANKLKGVFMGITVSEVSRNIISQSFYFLEV